MAERNSVSAFSFKEVLDAGDDDSSEEEDYEGIIYNFIMKSVHPIINVRLKGNSNYASFRYLIVTSAPSYSWCI